MRSFVLYSYSLFSLLSFPMCFTTQENELKIKHNGVNRATYTAGLVSGICIGKKNTVVRFFFLTVSRGCPQSNVMYCIHVNRTLHRLLINLLTVNVAVTYQTLGNVHC